MVVEVEKIITKTNEYKNIIDKYENTSLNIYSTLSNIKQYWKDDTSEKFFDKISKEKNKIKIFLDELEKITEINYAIINRYSKYGKKINFNLSKQEEIKNIFKLYIEKIEEIIAKYKMINPNNIIYINELISFKEKAQELNDIAEKKFSEIEKNEQEIKKIIDKISVEHIKR